jgi:chemotaxis protein methyltransferase CheR
MFGRFLEDACGIVLGSNKHYLVTTRLQRLMREFDLGSMKQVLDKLQSDRAGKFRTRLIDAMTTNETLWFRDTYPFTNLKDVIFPELIKQKITRPRIWSAACSSGQEVYSIIMTFREFSPRNPGAFSGLEVLGTDISPTMLEEANQGLYDSLSLRRGLPEEFLKKYFTKESDERYRIKADIRSHATFRELNLLENFSLLGKFDVIYCRNVLIYFSTELKQDILQRLAGALNPGGYLVLGSSESTGKLSDKFEMVRCNPRVIYRLKTP